MLGIRDSLCKPGPSTHPIFVVVLNVCVVGVHGRRQAHGDVEEGPYEGCPRWVCPLRTHRGQSLFNVLIKEPH